jgi:hypothetical protein
MVSFGGTIIGGCGCPGGVIRLFALPAYKPAKTLISINSKTLMKAKKISSLENLPCRGKKFVWSRGASRVRGPRMLPPSLLIR